MRFEVITGSLRLPPGDATQRPQRQTGVLHKPIGQTGNEIIDEKLVQLAIEFAERCQQQTGKPAIVHHRIVDERQTDTRSLQALKQHRRFQIEHPVDKPILRRSSAVVQLIGMKNDHPSRQAIALLAAITKRLYAPHGDAERIGIVPMQLEGISPKLCLDALDARIGRRGQDAVGLRRHAQTFKTLEDLSGYIVA